MRYLLANKQPFGQLDTKPGGEVTRNMQDLQAVANSSACVRDVPGQCRD